MAVKNFFIHYWKSIIFTCCILYLSFAPPSTFKGVPTFENEDKLVHLFLYFALTCILIFDFRQHAGQKHKKEFSFISVCILLPIILGGAVEILQPMYFAPRTAEWFDWFSDTAGVLFGWYVINLITRKISKRNRV